MNFCEIFFDLDKNFKKIEYPIFLRPNRAAGHKIDMLGVVT